MTRAPRAATGGLFALLLMACGAGDDPRPAGGPDAGAAEGDPWLGGFALRRGETAAGDPGACVDAPDLRLEPADGFPAGARLLHVDPAAPAGGDGSAGAPMVTVAEALTAAGGAPALVWLAGGEHLGPVETATPLALVGPCASQARLVGRVRLTGPGPHLVLGLTIRGPVAVEGATWARFRGARLLDAEDTGLTLAGVAAAEVVDSVVRGAGRLHVRAIDSALALRRTVVGPGPGAGVRSYARPGRAPDDCAGAHALCPHGGLLALQDTRVTGVAGRAVDVSRGLLHVTRSRIERVSRPDPAHAAVGVGLAHAFAAVAEGTVVADVDGFGVYAESARLLVRDARVERAAEGGVRVRRIDPADERALRVGTDWHPGWEWRPLPALGGPEWHPGWEWQPTEDGLPLEAHLPAPLRRDAADPGPDRDLHRWARTFLLDVEVQEAGGFGVRVADHVTDVVGLTVRGTRGEGSVGLWFEQPLAAVPDAAGFSAVVLSRVARATVEAAEGYGVLVSNTAIYQVVDGRPSGLVADDEDWERGLGRLRMESVQVRGSHQPGIVLVESTVDLRALEVDGAGGVGLWSIGAHTRVRGAVLSASRPRVLAARHGPAEIADGLIVEGSEPGSTRRVDVTDVSVLDQPRVGLLVVTDRSALTGRLTAARVEGNALEGARIGALGELAVEAARLEPRTDRELAVPEAPRLP